MIRVERSGAPPALLGTSVAEAARQRALEFFQSGTRANRQRDFEFDAVILASPDLRAALHRQFSGRCAFCAISLTSQSLLAGHYRPTQGAVNAEGSTDRSHYFWLAYEWANLYAFCEACLLAKGSKFPTANGRVRIHVTTENALAAERPLIIDPCVDDPEQFLVYLTSGFVVGRLDRWDHPETTFGVRARATIEALNLNRPNLVEERREQVRAVKSDMRVAMRMLEQEEIAEAVSKIAEFYQTDYPFAALRRQFANQQVQFRNRLMAQAFELASGDSGRLSQMVGSLRWITNAEMRDADIAYFTHGEPSSLGAPSSATKPNAVFQRTTDALVEFEPAAISRVEIQNFLGIEDLEISPAARVGEGRWTMLLGENGAGKTTVLKAIALAIGGGGPMKTLRLTPAKVLRQSSMAGHVRVWFTGSRVPVSVHFEEGERSLRFDSERPIPIVAFGPNRLLSGSGGGKTSLEGSVNIRNLFNPASPLSDPRSWLGEIDQGEFDAVARALKRVLLLDDDSTLSRRRGRLRFELPHGNFDLQTMSAGYQAMARMSLDMMGSFLFRWGSLEAAEGIVLVDELGAHLHPRWQMRIVGGMRSAFPRVQVIATTHDPLCLRGLLNDEVVVLRRRGAKVDAVGDLPPIEGLAVDQLLTSEFFGLNSTLDPVTEDLITEFQDRLVVEDINNPSPRLQELRQALIAHRLLGATLRERMALEAADTYLGQDRLIADEDRRLELKDETRGVLRDIWSRA